jgi:phosphatidate cytidylyltransferase
VTRVLSALVLLPVVIGTIWFLPPIATLVLAATASVLAFVEYAAMARALGTQVPAAPAGAGVLAACIAVGLGTGAADVLMASVIVIGALAVASGQPGPAILRDGAAAALAIAYIGLPLGALAATRAEWSGGGRWPLLLLLVVIVVSDSAQYYTGRAFGRRPLSPGISPKKTIEGAIGGVVFGTLAFAAGGSYVFGSPLWLLALLGIAISLLGIIGDLFESLLKRSAGVKDSSHLIPGHGGVLDRIDSWLFAAPVYYMLLPILTGHT